MNSNTDIEIDEVIQLMRTLNLSQIRKQLLEDQKGMAIRFQMVREFFQAAKEKMK